MFAASVAILTKCPKFPGALSSDGTPMPDILIHKYNRFVDSIFGRINKILKRSYDPVTVRLSTPEQKSAKKKLKANKKR